MWKGPDLNLRETVGMTESGVCEPGLLVQHQFLTKQLWEKLPRTAEAVKAANTGARSKHLLKRAQPV